MYSWIFISYRKTYDVGKFAIQHKAVETFKRVIWYRENKNRSKGPVLIGLEEIVQRQVGVGWVGRGRGG